MRGRDPGNYERESNTVEAVANKLGVARVRAIFFALPDPTVDIQIYDALPLASRAFIREATVHISALKYSELLEDVGDQATLIGLLSTVIPLRVQEVVRNKYGPDHPQAGP
jgi:hypothetical protein